MDTHVLRPLGDKSIVKSYISVCNDGGIGSSKRHQSWTDNSHLPSPAQWPLPLLVMRLLSGGIQKCLDIMDLGIFQV